MEKKQKVDKKVARDAAQTTIDFLRKIGGDVGSISDGDHTFRELYHHRAVLFALICSLYKNLAWKSTKHNDGTMYDGYFIVGIQTPYGQVSYHYEMKEWDLFDVKILDKGIEWDGSTPDEQIKRLEKWVNG